ncbi:MAG: hypothetical protein P8K66_07385 [Planctomycetota bacterium]|nr:hypothetical protein [Planctomycetota bacterium]
MIGTSLNSYDSSSPSHSGADSLEKAFWNLARNAEGGDPVAMQQLGLWLLRLSASENQLPPGVGKEGFRWISRALRKSEKLNSKTIPRSGVPGQRTSRIDL